MIDGLVADLKEEQLHDDHKKVHCVVEFGAFDDEQKALEKGIVDLEFAIVNLNDAITATAGEFVVVDDIVKVLDKADHTAHDEENTLMTSDSATKELIGIAK